jgi:hypothetical protein
MFDLLDEPQDTKPSKDTPRCLCYDHESSTLDRPVLWIPVIFGLFASSFLLSAIANLPFGIQLGSIIPYTAFVAMGTFSAQRGLQPFFFECSIVQQTMHVLIRRHCSFLVGILLFETIALWLTRYMPASWCRQTGRDGSPFAIALTVICICLASIQAFTNRSLLERAHEKSA